MDTGISFASHCLRGKVALPSSKSISNRVLLLNALCDSNIAIENLSDCDDTCTMLRILNSDAHSFDVGHAGTAMRFLTAFLARMVGRWELTGSERMKQRPIGVLVEALNRLGARIEYAERPGYPPLRIQGSYLKGGELEIAASVSSQYVSALLMIAPFMERGLTLSLTGKVVSRTYIDMTIALMREFGAKVEMEDGRIRVEPQEYIAIPFCVESDWSAASYFYELLVVAEGGELELPGLRENSLQGDVRQKEVWETLGVRTFFEEGSVRLVKSLVRPGRFDFDFVNMPDLVQSFAVACCIKEIPFVFTGVETLRIKETDRIAALIRELGKLGYVLQAEGDNRLVWDGTKKEVEEAEIATYHDHRMAMAFAPAALKYPGLMIRDKEVVTKSFPTYWEQLKKLGAQIDDRPLER